MPNLQGRTLSDRQKHRIDYHLSKRGEPWVRKQEDGPLVTLANAVYIVQTFPIQKVLKARRCACSAGKLRSDTLQF